MRARLAALLLALTRLQLPMLGLVTTGVYTGNGTSQTITIGLDVELLWIKKVDGSSPGVIKTVDMAAANARSFLGGVVTNRVTSALTTSFDVGSDWQVNRADHRYLYAGFDDANAALSVGTYTGDGSDDRSVVTSLSFQPELVIIIPGFGERIVYRHEDMSGDTSMGWADRTGALPDRIQQLLSNGFMVGTDAEVNGNGDTYYWAAFDEVAGTTQMATYTGNATAATWISGLGLDPDFVHIKQDADSNRAVVGTYRGVEDNDVACKQGPSSCTNDWITEVCYSAASGCGGTGSRFQISADDNVNASGIGYFYFVASAGAAVCTNSVCDATETAATCADCPTVCGDGVCGGSETACVDNCPEDCADTCGDGCCGNTEDDACGDCHGNCGPGCGGGRNACNCPLHCAAVDGDGCCGGGETACTSVDCQPVCGDGCCTGAENECTCAADCASSCGDLCCDSTETCSSCPGDCGTCWEPTAAQQPEGGDSLYSVKETGTASTGWPVEINYTGSEPLHFKAPPITIDIRDSGSTYTATGDGVTDAIVIGDTAGYLWKILPDGAAHGDAGVTVAGSSIDALYDATQEIDAQVTIFQTESTAPSACSNPDTCANGCCAWFLLGTGGTARRVYKRIGVFENGSENFSLALNTDDPTGTGVGSYSPILVTDSTCYTASAYPSYLAASAGGSFQSDGAINCFNCETGALKTCPGLAATYVALNGAVYGTIYMRGGIMTVATEHDDIITLGTGTGGAAVAVDATSQTYFREIW